MSVLSTSAGSSPQELLSKVSRYEALFELTAAISAAADIESAGEVLARRLKYVADIYSWRYVCLDGDSETKDGPGPTAIIVDGWRGTAQVERTVPEALSSFEADMWRERRTEILCGEAMSRALEQLPSHFQRDDLEQIAVKALVEEGRTQALVLFCKRRQAFTDLDLKCLGMVASFFHRKIHMLWQQQRIRDLEVAYLEQETMLRQSEKLATLGRLSAGMAHELNNPTAVARQGAEQLRESIERLEHAEFALGRAALTDEQREIVARLQEEARQRVAKPSTLDAIARSDLEEEVEDWLERKGISEPWELSPILVAMGLCVDELEELVESFNSVTTPIVLDVFATRFRAYSLLEEIEHGAGRVAEIVKALKGYSYMDQAPVQSVDVRDGLNDTLTMLAERTSDAIRIELDFEEGLPTVEGSGAELNQVWTHLIDNALSAMDGSGTLELKAYSEERWVVVEVVDSGPGIPSDLQDKIFDPFFTTKAPGEGTGLGLNVSHGIVVEKHDGRISVQSKPGDTRFRVMLPRSDWSEERG